MADSVQVLELLLTARYVGAPAFNSISRDIDALVNNVSGLSKVGAAMSLVGTGMTAAGIGLATFAVESMKQASAYQDAVQRIISVHGIGADQVQRFNDAVMQTGERFGQNSTDIASALYYVTSTMEGLGYSISNNKAVAKDFFDYIIPSMGAFVAASGHGLGGSVSWSQAGQDVTHLAGAFGLTPDQWANMMGAMTYVENTGGVTQQQLMAGSLRFTSTARELGLNYQDVFAAIGAMSTAGVYGARGGTELGAGFRQLLANSTSLKALQSIGLDPHDFYTNGQIDDPGLIVAMINSKLQGIKDPLARYQIQQKIYGAVGNRAFGILAQPNTLGIYQGLLSGESQNPIARMFGVADSQLSSFAGSVKKLTTAFQDFMKLVGGPLLNAVQPWIDKLTGALDRVNNALRNPKNAGYLSPQFLGKTLPGMVFGGTAGLLTMGPALQMGGGWLRDFAIAQDTKHLDSKEKLSLFQQMTGMRRDQLLATHDLTRKSYADRIALLMKDGGGAAGMTAGDLAKLDRFDSPFMKEFNRQRIQYILDQMPRTKTGQLAASGGDIELRRKLNAYMKTPPGTTAWGQTDHAARRYVADNWNKIAGQLGFDPNAGPNRDELKQLYIKQAKEKGPNKGLERAVLQQKQFEKRAAQQLEAFDQNTALRTPKVELSAAEKLGKMFSAPFKGLGDFGQKFSPLTLAKQGGSAFWGKFGEGITGGAKAFGGRIKGLNLVGSGFSNLGAAGAIGDEVAGAGKNPFLRMAEAIGKFPKNALTGIVDGFKGFGSAIMGGVRAIPGLIGSFASLGSAAIPIIAIVLLIVGAITILVLIFMRYRTQAMQVVQTIQNALMPVFKMFMTVVMSVLKSIEKAWHDHQKQIDTAMKALLQAVASAAPFFKEMFAVIVVILMVVIKVIGYLVVGFINALPQIIAVFTAIFKVLGDLGRLISDIIHGKWGAAWKEAQNIVKDAWAGIQNFVGMIGTFIGSVFKGLWDDVKGPLQGFWKSITDWFSNLGKTISDTLKNAVTGAGNAVKSAFTGHSPFTFGGMLGGHAAGGSIRTPELSWVGEKGPELMLLPGGSRIFSHQDSTGLMHALTGGGSSRQLALQVASLHVASVHGLEGLGTGQQQQSERPQRTPAEEYFFARGIQQQREDLWNRYPNTSREFDHTYRRSYQYYG